MRTRLMLVVLLLFSVVSAQTSEHKFLDKKGIIYLSSSGAVFAADGAITCTYLGSGPYRNHEAFLPIKSCAGIGTWMGGSFAAQTATAYYFHRTGHHRLERIAEMFWSSGSAIGITYNLTHKPKTPPGEGSKLFIITHRTQ